MPAFSLIPMLQIQRDLYDIPRGLGRFKTYLDVMIGGTNDIALPLPAFNPMGKAHVATTLDTLLSLNAENVATQAVTAAERRLKGVEALFKLGLVVADDVGGGWTNRYYAEIGNRFQLESTIKRGWAVTLFWTSEVPTREVVQAEVLATIYRTTYYVRHGAPQTLGQMMKQEGLAMAFAGARGPLLEPDDLDYTREVISSYRDSDDLPTLFACLYGDKAAQSVGYTPLGLSPRAAYAVALSEARKKSASPESLL